MLQITVSQGLLIALWGFIMGLDDLLEFGLINRPLPAAAMVGLILGDPATGCIVGALAELSFTGLVPMGGASVPNGTTSGVMSAVLAITQNLSPAEAFALSLPFGYLVQYINVLKNTVFSFFNDISDRIAETGNYKKMIRFHFLTISANGLMYAIILFMCAYAAQNQIGAIVALFPEKLIQGLRIGGGLMPAIGFSMMLSIIFKPKYLPYLLIGFVLACFIDYGTILPVAVIGTAIALINYFTVSKESTNGGQSNGI